MASWTPEAASVGQLVNLLKQTLSPDNQVQRDATKVSIKERRRKKIIIKKLRCQDGDV